MKQVFTGKIVKRDNLCPHGNTGDCYLCKVFLDEWTKRFIESQVDLPHEIQAMVDKNFWDLLA